MLDLEDSMVEPLSNIPYNTSHNPTVLHYQQTLEDKIKTEAEKRLDKDFTKSTKRREWATSKLGRRYVKQASNTFYPAVASFMDVSQKAKAGRHFNAAKLLAATCIEPEVVSYLASKAVFNFIGDLRSGGSRIRKSTMAIRLADYVHDEWRIRHFADTEARAALLKKLLKDFDRRTYPRDWRKRTITHYFHEEQINWEGWTKRQKVNVGYALLCLFIQHTGLLIMDTTHVEATSALVEHVKNMASTSFMEFVLYRPMLVKPRPWDADRNLFRGGYLTRNVRAYPIIKRAKKRDVARLVEADWSSVLPPVNALQETPWRVNATMLEALEWAYHSYGGKIGKLAKADDEALPSLPPAYDTDEQVKSEHNRLVFEIHDRNRQEKSKRISALMTMKIAREYLSSPEMYFPHNLDNRGRAYPIAAFLNPQGPDYSKALLELSKGETVDDQDGIDWIAIIVANAYGEDKISLADRIKWTSDNEEMILSIAADYRTDHRWMHASEPFMFLRACFEWDQYKKVGLGFTSHIVCSVDATCSGLQHYAAMFRDERGGRSVNLVPGLDRQDVYGDVAVEATRQLLDDGSPAALDWLRFGIDRKITKRQVMVVPYNGKFSSCMNYTREAVAEKVYDEVQPVWNRLDAKDHSARIALLSGTIWQSIKIVVVKAREGMTWLSSIASAFARAENKLDKPSYDRRMTWVTPDGFEVVQYEPEESLNRIDTFFDGRVQLGVYEETGRLNPRDMASSVAPNFVHSMDACHLRMTIKKALEIGITDFAMVHDSFGVHAAHMKRFLAECVKPAFIEMYRRDVIGDFYERFKHLGIEKPPEKGTLDLEAIQGSEFFFS